VHCSMKEREAYESFRTIELASSQDPGSHLFHLLPTAHLLAKGVRRGHGSDRPAMIQ
jgi:hypothetical protein